jgi:hypothetical protein
MNERRTTSIANVVADVVAAPERRGRRPAVGTRERTDGRSAAIATTCALTRAAIGGVCGLLLLRFGGGLSRRGGGIGSLCGIHVGSSVDCVVVGGTTGAR